MSAPKQLPTRQLGKDGPRVPAMGFGLMGLSVGYGQCPSVEERLKVLDRAWEIGATFWDSAAVYGDNEDLIGKWFAQHPRRRKDIFLATKCALSFTLGEDNTMKMVVDSSPESCRAYCEASLAKLGTDYIDLFYVHRFDGKTPVEKTMEGLVQLKKEGKIRHIGFSECSSNTLRRGHAVHPIAAAQIEYNPWTLDIEGEAGTHLLRTCRDLGVSVIAYSPLGRGFLTGRYRSPDDFGEGDFRKIMPRFSPENFPKNLELVKKFEDLAASKGATPAQVVLAWILAQGEDFIPIPGTKSIKYLEQNFGALNVTITPEEDTRIRDMINSMGGPSGTRYISPEYHFGDTPAL